MMAVVQVGQQGTNPWAKRRSRLHPNRYLGPITPATPPTAATEQFHSRHSRPDRRQIDMVVTMAAALVLPRHICPAVTTGRDHHPLCLVPRFQQRARLPRGGRLPPDALRCFLPLPNLSFEDGIYELDEALRGLPTIASSSDIRAPSRSIISYCWDSRAFFSVSLSPMRGGVAIRRSNQIMPHSATPSANHVSSYGSGSA